MKFDKNLAAIHGYLCSDGYVIKNPKTQKHKYYYIGFRNLDEVLLKDFQKKFISVFNIKPIITNEGRCKIQNKEIYYFLTKEFSYYSYEWELPRLSKEKLKFWLRAFFDAEAWVENQPRKSRLIGLECCNEKGILDIQQALKKFNIPSTLKKKTNRNIFRLTICGLNNLKRFKKEIDFLHPKKKEKLLLAINSYLDYNWIIPQDKNELFNFIKTKGKIRNSRDEIRFTSIKNKNVLKLRKTLNNYKIKSKLFGPWGKSSKYYCLIIKKEDICNGKTKNWTSSRDQAC